MNPYQHLIEAIIIQAAEDYRKALRGKTYDSNLSDEKIVTECEDFFRSEWYRDLTKVNGEMLIKKLREEYKNECTVNSTDSTTN